MNVTPRDARQEAVRAVDDDGLHPLVLEPSPPANLDPEYMADDPTVAEDPDGRVVSPASDGDLTWSELVERRPQLAAFTRPRWLGPVPRLVDLPDGYTTTRDALHQVAFFAIAPKRFSVTEKLGLRWTIAGFGTPFFGDEEQVRVEGDLLILQQADSAEARHLTTVREACEFLGIDYQVEWFSDFHDPLEPVDADAELDIDPNVTHALGDWFGFATSVLEELRRTDGAVDPSRVQLWPEHFDPAIEIGSPDEGTRASYGASPGDEFSSEPYLYVSPWGEVDESDPYWESGGFGGAAIGYGALLEADDQRAAALEFFRTGVEKLSG